ncbi:hemerythrin [Bordetella genomosp. 10]|uniref:Hemerythrin n=1 Tax=Bordetella genomosp. 10 TaxID=1416804 RepID=A0A261SL24_9BORD|nr:hemerythrin domain-containing protein [Bordetella genomosp. 10]OZI38124.1 hemerythrin [Bordetella genomosp. 10]
MPANTIYEALRESHDIQRALCTKLVRAAPHGNRRREIYRELKIELAAHAAAEERYLYAPILMDDMGLDSSRHALSEHHEIDECVEELGKADAQGGSWLAKARKLSEEVRHHLREEEKKFFQVSGKILTDAQKSRLARLYLKDYQRMKTVLAQQ